MEDKQIVDLYFARDEQAITQTASKYGKLCMKVVYAILPVQEECDECLNDTYLKMWNSIPPNRPDNLRAYSCRIARNTALDKLKFATRKRRYSHQVEII